MASYMKVTNILCLLLLLSVVAKTGMAQAKGRIKGGSQSYNQRTEQSAESSSDTRYQRQQISQNYDSLEAPFERQQVAQSYAEEAPFQQQQVSQNYGASRGTCERPKGPRNGSMRCQITSEKHSCRGACRTGYAFPDGSITVTVECYLRQGQWTPFKDFPTCTSSRGGSVNEQQREIHQSDGSSNCPRLHPENAQVSCRETSYNEQCQVTCNPGYEFPGGTRQLTFSCSFQEGRWMPQLAFQDCQLQCHPECQNGGRCLLHNVCQCTQDFRGNRCQYPVSFCDFARLGSVQVAYDCFHTPEFTECRVSCPSGMTFDPPASPVYRCTVDGLWNPPVTPRCTRDSLCEQPPSPMNGKIQCSGNNEVIICRATCTPGYTFPEGFLELSTQCQYRTGHWSPSPNFPDCEPTCHPECMNGGRCLGHNRCLCSREYRGSTCQYSITNCDGHLRFAGVAWNCQHHPHETECHVSCGETGRILDPPSPVTYVCSLDGSWNPAVKPRCIENSRYRDGHDEYSGLQQQSLQEIEGFENPYVENQRRITGSHKSGLTQEQSMDQDNYDVIGQELIDHDADSFHDKYVQDKVYEDAMDEDFESTSHLYDLRNQPRSADINEEDNEINLIPDTKFEVPAEPEETRETERESEKMEDKVSGFSVPSESRGMCSIWGYHHYRTFDGLAFTFPGTCDYVLASDCDTGEVSIILRQKCESSSASCFKAVEIQLPGNRFFLTPAGVLQNDEPSPIPVHVGNLIIERISRYLVAKMTTGFIVWIDPDANVHITADNILLQERTCGLCGNNDGKSQNDAVSPDFQSLPNPFTYGNSWEVPGHEECVDASGQLAVCNAETREEREVQSKASILCASILDQDYQECLNLVDPEVFFRMCQMDCCSVGSVDDCECSTFAQFFMECERLGGSLGSGWRRPAFCPIHCENGTEFQQCGAACPRTCSNLDPTCPVEKCVDGCHCPPGTVMEEDTCTPIEKCPCHYGETKYESGEERQMDCNTCSCIGGKWECTENICSATCSVSGPHFKTFDGLMYDLHSACSHYIVQHDDFSIIIDFIDKCPMSPLSTCARNVIIRTSEGTVVKMKPGMEVTVNGQEVPSLPVSAPHVYVTQATSIYMKAQLNTGVEILWDGGSSVRVNVPPELFGHLRGLCGTFTESQTDDFLTPEGDTELTAEIFAMKWKVDPTCKETRDVAEPLEGEPCERAPRRRAEAVRLCKILSGPVFSECHRTVFHDVYYQSCLYDVCSCEVEPEQCLCASLAEYAATCARMEKMLSWRREVPQCGIHCPVGQVYEECADSCMYSCSVIAGNTNCRKNCVEGCVCPQGLTLNENQQCVSPSSCSCMHSGHMYPPDFLQRRGREMCECSYGQWTCRHATASDIILTPPPNVAVYCSEAKNEEHTDCISQCPRTCDNLHHHEPCTVSICTPGCRCKRGYVLDTQSNSCVLPNDCPCHHGGRSYADSAEIKMDCNTCNCEGGKWKCEENPCPGLCRAWGESHYSTFDGRIFDFLGDCDFVLVRARLKENEMYSVIIQNVPCGTGGSTCSKSLIISLGAWSITLTREHPLPPVPEDSRLTLSQLGMFTLIHSDIGISIQWDRGTRIHISAEPVWKGKLQGLCGDFNSDSSDDFKPPSGDMPLVRPQDFADTWRVHEYCRPSMPLEEPCETRPERREWARNKCAVLKSELFESCHAQVQLEPYYTRCILDACGCDKGGDCQCFCAAVATYAQECARNHVVIPWRSQDLCPVQCETCDRYSPCISLCPPLNCETLTENTEGHSCTHEPCVDGCQPKPCKAGYVYKNLNNLTCIKTEECEEKPCAIINGVSYREGERIQDDQVGDACQSCYCRNGEADCIGVPCTSTVTPTPVVLLPECDFTGWTPWIDSMDPEDNDGNDVENLRDLAADNRIPCPFDHVISVRCRSVDTQAPSETTGQKVTCDLENGLVCERTDEECSNYEIQVYCNCVPEVTCPSDQKWSDCAFHCESTCHSLKQDLSLAGVCQENQKCVSGCSHTTCEAPYVARDADTCVLPEMCTCQLDSGYLLAPGEVVPNGCEKCQCLNNSLLCSTTQDCKPTPTPKEVKKAKRIGAVLEEVPPEATEKECSEGWTSWINNYSPTSLGETEYIDDYNDYCPGGQITAIECRDLTRDEEYQRSGLSDIHCNLTGFYCLNSMQALGRTCPDYKIRLYCDCLVTQPGTPVPEIPLTELYTSSPKRPKILPAYSTTPTTGTTTSACSYWSEWINTHKPKRGRSFGEREDTLPFILQQTEGFCKEGTVSDIECRDLKRDRDYKETKEVKLICDLQTGFLCKNDEQPDGRCLDYKIRYFCTCETVSPTATTIIMKSTTPSYIFPCSESDLGPIIDGTQPLSDAHLKASTSLSPKSGPQSARLSSSYGLKSEGSWTAKIPDDSQFIEVDFGDIEAVYGVLTKGKDGHNEWVTSYQILYSPDALSYSYYFDENDMPKVFPANYDSSGEVKHIFENPFEARFVRIQPVTWEGSISLRFELLRCKEKVEERLILPQMRPTMTTIPTPTIEECKDPMGLENGLISDSQLSASSSYDSSLSPVNGRLGSTIAWAAAILNEDQYLQIDLMEPRNIAGVVTKGREDVPQWVSSYGVAYSNDGVTWNKVADDKGEAKVFPANFDQDSLVTNMFPSMIRTRYLRIIPKTWKNWISLQAEILGCFHPYFCKDPMGIEGGFVSNGQLSSSSQYDESLSAQNGRLDSSSAWAAKVLNTQEFLQVDFLEKRYLTGVVTQGRHESSQWVTAYEVAYSDDGKSWDKITNDEEHVQEFRGNSGSDTAVINLFSGEVKTRFLRILPTKWKGWISMRLEVLGCYQPEVCKEPMGLENGLLSDSQLSASSSYDNSVVPSHARLHDDTGWMPAMSNVDQYLQVDFMEPRNVSAIVTKGRGDSPHWVTAYKVSYSDDGKSFQDVLDELGEVKEFEGNEDPDTPVSSVLPETIEARFLRIIPISWKDKIGLRLEALGCYHPYTCREPMGLENNAISNFQLTSSSDQANLDANSARLNSDTAWAAEILDENQYLQVDFVKPQNISAVVTQGRNDATQWVSEYVIDYSDDGEKWEPLINEETGKQKEFIANYDCDSPVTNTFPETIETRFIRIKPTKWKNWISLRFEILGCLHPSVCEEPMGLENGLLDDSQISASSYGDESVLPSEARLSNEYSAWVPETLDNEYLQVDFLEPRNISAIVTKGRPDEEHYVTAYNVLHSDDGELWKYVDDELGNPLEFPGNIDQNTPVINPLPNTLETRFVRIVPTKALGWIGLRAEILGCYHPYPKVLPTEPTEAVLPLTVTLLPLPLAPVCGEDGTDEEISLLTDAIVTVSSIQPGGKPSQIYLNTKSSKGLSGAWVPRTKDLHPSVTVMIPDVKLLVGIVIQGREDSDEWVKTFRVIASEDGQSWQPLFDLDGNEEMTGSKDQNSIFGHYFKEPVAAKFVKIIPESWNKRASMRMDLRGCSHPLIETTVPPTIPPFLELCPEMETALITSCPESCPPGLLCDGKQCVDPVDCVCVHDGKIFMVSDKIEDETCVQCDCALGGHSVCSTKTCPPCEENKKQTFRKNCSCECEECTDGFILCPTSQECISEENWCDGIIDCPDDEANCKTTTVAALPLISEAPEKPENATCEILGRHINTFDGQELNYDTCNHMVLRDIKDDAFNVIIHKDCSSGNECKHWLQVVYESHDIEVTSDLDVNFDGHQYTASQLVLINKNPSLNISMEKVGDQVIIKSISRGLTIVYDIRAHLKVGISPELMQNVAGLCGFYSGVENDDQKKPDGNQASTSKEFGDSWAVEGSDNCKPLICPMETVTKALKICNELREDPFTVCADIVSVDTFIEFCLSSTCECLEKESNSEHYCKCDSFLPLIEACEKKIGPVPLRSWRFKHSCAPTCPPGLKWDDCGPSCQLTCDQLAMDSCSDDCVAGCFCPPGTVLNGEVCVSPERCSDKVCQGFGDPHLETYDGLYYPYQSVGTFLISGDDAMNFAVEGITERCTASVPISCVTGIQVTYKGQRVQMWKNKPVTLNGQSIPVEKLPAVSDGMIVLGFPGGTFITLIPELSIEARYYEENSGFAVKIPSKRYFNKTIGLCGNCNAKLQDELRNNPLSDFVCSWLTDGDEDSCKRNFKEPEEVTGTAISCEKIKDETFKSCHPLVDPDKYVKACNFDAVYSGDELGSFCKTVMGYARQCCQVGEVINDWAERYGCNISCPEGLKYRQCHDACPQTCDIIKNSSREVDCHSLKVDGCFCPEGDILKDGKCVDSISCEMCDTEGHTPGDTWNDGPCKICHCSETLSIDCTVQVCPQNPVCGFDEVLYKTERERETCCEIYTCVKAPKDCPLLEVPKCPEGQVAKVRKSEDHCPSYYCECDPLLCPPVVVPSEDDLELGEVGSIINASCCPHFELKCALESCPEKPECVSGLELTEIPAKCCTLYKCKPEVGACVYIPQYDVIDGSQVEKNPEELVPKTYKPGESWEDGLCHNCTCEQVQDQFVPHCVKEQCLSIEYLPENKDYYLHESHSKFKCCPEIFRLHCKDEYGTLYEEGQEWESPNNPCVKYSCEMSIIENIEKVKKVIECPDCPKSSEYLPPSKKLGQCCGVCRPSKCEEKGTLYEIGDKWVPEFHQCQEAKCTSVGGMPQIIYTYTRCPVLPDDCPKGKIVKDEQGCCELCNVTSEIHCSTVPIPLEETVGIFTYYDVSYGGKCVNEDPVPQVLLCSGACHSESYYSLEDGDFKSMCKCCKVNVTVKKDVELKCPDGNLLKKEFLQPETCQCSKCAPAEKKPWAAYQLETQSQRKTQPWSNGQQEQQSWDNEQAEQEPWRVGQFQQEENDYDF